MTVYRRDDFTFPPARGRRGVEFRPDGTFVELQIGRGDAPEPSDTGRWATAGTLTRTSPTTDAGMPGGSAAVAGKVVRVEPDRLEIVWE
ncbi:hypothetical protein GCM10009789_61460 [Kribbella sancticallisti]|uniref:Uncharacterized protein n=1 Tax=Kribbella sancticallisti TaxID=460087 RepID=A0ABP4Q2P6_9ACTN